MEYCVVHSLLTSITVNLSEWYNCSTACIHSTLTYDIVAFFVVVVQNQNFIEDVLKKNLFFLHKLLYISLFLLRTENWWNKLKRANLGFYIHLTSKCIF